MREKLSRCEVLKALLALGTASKYQLKPKFNVSRTTINRKVENLKEEGMISITKGPRNADICNLEFKGLTYLLLKCNVKEKELEATLTKFFSTKPFKNFERFIKIPDAALITTLTESMVKLRSRVNFDHFDEDWVLGLFLSIFDEAFFKRFDLQKHSNVHTPKDLKRYLDAIGVTPYELRMFCQEDLKEGERTKKSLKHRISKLKKLVNLARTLERGRM